MTLNYMTTLTLRIGSGLDRLDIEHRRSIADFTRRFQTDDGGFAGRRGRGDIYYTSFALRTLALLGELKDDSLSEKVFAFLLGFVQSRMRNADCHSTDETGFPCITTSEKQAHAGNDFLSLSSVELVSLVIGATLLQLVTGRDLFDSLPCSRKIFGMTLLNRLRVPGSGYRSSEKSGLAGVYHTFLAMICRELIGTIPDGNEPKELADFLVQHVRSDGGFVEMIPLRSSGTNPTAAGIALTRILRQYDAQLSCPYDPILTKRFLLQRQSQSGGFCAHSGVMFPDLLSTFSAVVTLLDLNDWHGADGIDLGSTVDFVRSCRLHGGCKGGAFDDTPDVEYAFYGLALDSILTEFQER